MKIDTIRGIALRIFLLSVSIGYLGLLYGLSDEGRLTRDYNIYSPKLRDSDVKSLWCGFLGFPEPYKNIQGNQYCGDIQVEMECTFTNKGDHCIIK